MTWKPPEGVKQYKDSFDFQAVPSNEDEMQRMEREAVGKLFGRARDHLGKLIQAVDDIHEAKPSGYKRDELFALLEAVQGRLDDWRKS